MKQPVYIYKQILYSLLFASLFISCRQEIIENQQLLEADALMENHPDSALILLESIQEPAKMKKADQALYALLLTQAHDRNEITHTDDSLIQMAVDHYKHGGNVYRKAQSLYYLGCVYEDMDNIVLSIDALLKAEEALGGKYGNDGLMCLIYSSLAHQYRKQGFYGKGMEPILKKITFREKRKTTFIITSCTIVLIIILFSFMMIDKYRKSHIIQLKRQLMRNRTETSRVIQQEDSSETPHKKTKLEVLRRLCIESIRTSGELFKKTAVYKEIHSSDRLNKEIYFHSKKRNRLKDTIDETFPDAFLSLRDLYNLTTDDAYCCILYSLNLSNRTVAACMGVAEGAVKTRKSRIKNKIDEKLSGFLFSNN
ncbi:MAG: hypothetical protein LBG18_06645 [Mediterranea sp.]|jgi:DNA-directed RNA polymerase specialized sigma24 family protein|nr:hypothetical protein [Mediterranea sp.]